MTLPLLYIRIKQLQRVLNELGLYLFLLIPLTGFLIFACYTIFDKSESAHILMAALACSCILVQYYRKDKLFVYKHIESPHLQMFSEYAALTFPFSISCLITPSWYWYPILLAFLFCIPLFTFNKQQRVMLKNLSAIISPSNVEWLSGTRKHFIPLTALYVLALAFCWFNVLPLILLWFMTVVLTSFFIECESLPVLREGERTAVQFLLHKGKVGSMYMLVLYSPVLIVNTICNMDYLMVNVLFIPAQLSILYFAICLKYSAYKPNTYQAGNNIPLAFVSMGAALPYLLPIPIILSFFYFYKAENNLKKYLNG